MGYVADPVEIDSFIPGLKYKACCGKATLEDLVGASKEMGLLYFNVSLNVRVGENKYEVIILGSRTPGEDPSIEYSKILDPENDEVLRKMLLWKMPQDWKEYWARPLDMFDYKPGIEALTDYMRDIKSVILKSIPYSKVSFGPDPNFLNPSYPHSLR